MVARELESNRRLEHRYERALAGLVGRLHRDVEAAIVPKLSQVARADAWNPFGTAIDGIVAKYVMTAPRDVGGVFARHAKSVSSANAKQMRAIGIRPTDTRLEPEIAAARDRNIQLVEKAYRSYAADVRQIFEDPATFGQSVDVIKSRLVERGNVSESRAELIARDQTLKLNGAITKTRQENAGVRSYVWSTSLDERVRPEHAALEGKTFDWNSPPPPGHPGEDYQCRCVALPVIPELEGENAPAPAPLPPPAPPPAPPPTGVQEGVQARQVDVGRGVARDFARRVLESVSDEGTTRFLKKEPLSKVVFKPQTRSGRKETNGWYHPVTHELQVTADRQPHTFGQAFVPGHTWSISMAGTTKEEAAQATFRHEIGHHVHMVDRQADQIVSDAYLRATKAWTFITRYAETKPEEYFAESYAAYYLRREALRVHDPNGFRMVEDVLPLRGILK